jgi:uncharacterized protein involved in oxidation of intracellular sulfur
MNLGVIIYSNDPETISNALEFAGFALKEGDFVSVSLLGKGVEVETLSKYEGLSTRGLQLAEQMQEFVDAGGRVLASGKCIEARNIDAPRLCTVSSMRDIYDMVRESDKVVTF